MGGGDIVTVFYSTAPLGKEQMTMAPVVTQRMLERSVTVLQNLQPWAGYTLGWAYGQPRLEAHDGSMDISMRGTKRYVNEVVWVLIKVIRMAEAHDQDTTAYVQRLRS